MLKFALGPTYSQLITRCWETLAPSAIGIFTRLCCYYYRDLQSRPVHRTSRPSFGPIGTPFYQTERIWLSSTVSVAGLSPVHFRLTLSQHFGTLTVVWVVPLSEHELNPRNPPLGFSGANVFGVQKKGETFRSLPFRLVLYPVGGLPQGLTAINFEGN